MIYFQEYDVLMEQLITGQVTRAQQAEEILLLRNELAITRKKLIKLETQEATGQEQRNVGVVPQWAETNGHAPASNTQEPHVSGCGHFQSSHDVVVFVLGCEDPGEKQFFWPPT